MRVVVQRVERASVCVGERQLGRVDSGMLVLAGFAASDTEETLRWMADKIVGLRVFADADGRMNLDLEAVGGGLLIVSQFTLYGDVSRGRRPSFVDAAPPDQAHTLYNRFLEICAEGPCPVEAGEFGGMMHVELVNSGPVTLVIER